MEAPYQLFRLVSLCVLLVCAYGVTYGQRITLPAPGFQVERAQADRNRPVRAHAKREYRAPLIDMEVHLANPNNGKIDEEFLKKLWATIQREGVEYAFFMPTPNDGRHTHHEIGVAQNKRMVEISQRRVRLFCCSNYITYWMHGAHDGARYKSEELDLVLKRLSQDLDSGEYLGVGEIATHHFKKTEFQGIIRYPR